jgi:hypothetical protein
MNKFSITMLTLVGMTTGAMAQGAAKAVEPKAPPPAAAKDAKAGAPAAPKAADPKAAAPAVAPKAPEGPPKPPAEIAATLKGMGARKTCTGIGMGGADMKTELKFKATMANKLALDGWWIQQSFTGTMGEGKTAMKFKMENYIAWDAKAAKWRTIAVMNDGSAMVGTADMKDGKYEGVSDTFGGMMGPGKFKEHGDMTDKAGSKMWGEASMDGKTWMKVYEMTCK